MKIDNQSLFGESVKPIGLASDHAGFEARSLLFQN